MLRATRSIVGMSSWRSASSWIRRIAGSIAGAKRLVRAAKARHRLVAVSEERRERHPVHVARARRGRGIQVTVRIHPNHAKPLAAGGEVRGRTGDRAGRKRMVSSENNGELPGLERRAHLGGDVGADGGDGTEIARATLRPLGGILTKGNDDVANILDGMPELLEHLPEVGVSDGGWAHVHPAARGAEIHGDADDSNGSHAAKPIRRRPNAKG